MPLFKCHKCGCIENTALGAYWWKVGKEKQPPICSECHTGKWHEKFPKETPEEARFVELKNGFYGPSDGSWGPVKPTSEKSGV